MTISRVAPKQTVSGSAPTLRRWLAYSALWLVMGSGLSACQEHPSGTSPEAREAPTDQATETIAFVDVHVVDTEKAEVQRKQTVLVKGDRIVAVGSHDSVAVPENARVVPGRGQLYLMPGLVDMHIHMPPGDGAVGGPVWRVCSLLLANGVTTARGLIGHPSHVGVRDMIDRGELLGPTFYAGSPPLHVQSVPDAEQARNAVVQAKQAGFDLIKSHHLTDAETYAAVQEEARLQGLAVSGHVSNEIGLERAIAAGQQIEHLDGFLAALVADETGALPPYGQFPNPQVMQAIDRQKIAPLAQRIQAQEIWNTPTLHLFASLVDPEVSTESLSGLDELRYVPAAAAAQWKQQRHSIASSFPAELAKDFISLRQEITRQLDTAGAGLLAGSDSPQLFQVSGFSLHHELAALEQAGLTPARALASATVGPARYLAKLPGNGSSKGRAPDFGRVAAEQRADLVLLQANPLEEVRNARQILGVMVRGEYLDRAALDRLLSEVEASVKPPEPGPVAPG